MITKYLILKYLFISILSSFCFISAQTDQMHKNDVYIAGVKMSPSIILNNEESLSSSSFDTLYSFPGPGTYPAGLAWDGQYLWNCDSDSQKIYKLTTTGDVVYSFPIPNNATSVGGLEWDGNNIWFVDEQGAMLYKLDAVTGSVLEQFSLPSSGQADPNGFGLAWDGQNIWHSDYNDAGNIYKLDPQNGQVLSSFVPPKSSILGITWANNFLYGVSIEIALSGGFLYKFDPSSGTVLDSAFWEIPYPLGLVWDGSFFWNVSGNAVAGGNSRIYQASNILAGIDNAFLNQPERITLAQNYPNPFNPNTTIKYQIPELSFVTLKVYDILGNAVVTLINEEIPAGNYEVEFIGDGLTSGIYFYELQAGNYVKTKKMMLMR